MNDNVNEQVVDRFRRLVKSNRLAHAYLFIGPSDAGKTKTALAIAKLVNCEHPSKQPCGECAPCRRIEVNAYPDVTVTNPDERDSIKIEVIREMLERFRLRSYEAKMKVFILCDVECMETAAANAFLKTLEEPAPNTLIILTTSVPEANLDTIKSRCHQVKFFPQPANRVAKLLEEEGMDKSMSSFLAIYADGCLGKARKLAQEGIWQRKNRIIDQMLFSSRLDEVLKDLAGDKGATIEALNVLLSFCRDAVLIKSGMSEENVVHKDRLPDIKAFSGRSLSDLAAIVSQIVRVRQLVDENLNVKMSLTLLKERIK